MKSMIITLDGPAGAGKSSVSRQLAQRLGVDFLDTGAMYRGITAYALSQGIDPTAEPQRVARLSEDLRIFFKWEHSPPRLTIAHHEKIIDLTARLRDQDVAKHVSPVAAISQVRQVLVQAQRRIGNEHPRLVTEGRDQGSLVFPDASVKFYIDASPAVRVSRRAVQLKNAGRANIDLKQIQDDIAARDFRDMNRKDGPLVCPQDAIVIDTSDLEQSQVIDLLEKHVRENIDPASLAGVTAK